MTKKKKTEEPAPEKYSAMEQMRINAAVCITHHGACDCREYHYALLRLLASWALTMWRNTNKETMVPDRHDLEMLGKAVDDYFGVNT